MPLQVASADSGKSRLKKFMLRVGSVFAVVLVIFACLMPMMEADARQISTTSSKFDEIIEELDNLSNDATEISVEAVMGDYSISAEDLPDQTFQKLINIFVSDYNRVSGFWYGVWEGVKSVFESSLTGGSYSTYTTNDLIDEFDTMFPGFCALMLNSSYFQDGIENSTAIGDAIRKALNQFTMIDLINRDVSSDSLGGVDLYNIDLEGILTLGDVDYFTIISGVNLSDIFDNTDNAFKAILVGAVSSSFAGAISSISDMTDDTIDLLELDLQGSSKEEQALSSEVQSEVKSSATQAANEKMNQTYNTTSGAFSQLESNATVENGLRNSDGTYNWALFSETDPILGSYKQTWNSYYKTYDLDEAYSTMSQDKTSNAKAANSTIYSVAYDICKKVMIPIAAVILAFVFAYDIYEMVCERNNMNEIGGGAFVQLILKIVIAIVLILYGWELIELIFKMGNLIVSMAVPITDNYGMNNNDLMSAIDEHIANTAMLNEGDQNAVLQWIIAVQLCLNATIDFGNMLVLLVQGLIINIGVWVLSIIIYVIVYVRLIEIYIDCCVAPIPLATLTNRSWQQTGMNYLRSVFALALQAFIIFLCLSIFNVLVNNALDGILYDADLTGTMWTVVGYSLILAFCLFKSGGLSKSIMAAH